MRHESRTMVLLHDLWLSPSAWDPMRRYYESSGYEVHVPAWLDGSRSIDLPHTDSKQHSHVSLASIAAAMEDYVRGLEEPPILIGHGLGGLIVQRLLDGCLGSVGIAIGSAPPRGVFPSLAPILQGTRPYLRNPLHGGKPVSLRFDEFYHLFANTMHEPEARRAYHRDAVSVAGRLFWEVALAPINPWSQAAVNFTNDQRAPLLLVAASEDQLSPPALVRRIFHKHCESAAVTAYKEFSGRSHLCLVQEGWEEIAASLLRWATTQIYSVHHLKPETVFL